MSWNEGNIGVAVLYAVLRGPLHFPVGQKYGCIFNQMLSCLIIKKNLEKSSSVGFFVSLVLLKVCM